MFLLKGKRLPLDVAFTNPDTGIQYPAVWLRRSSLAERKEIGITETEDPVPFDVRFQFGWTDGGNPIWKDHAQLVAQWIQQTRATANTLLAPTDWIIIREADNGKPADPVLRTWREEIRLASGSKVYEIKQTVDTAALAAYITGADYPTWPADPYAPVPVSDAGDTPADGLELPTGGEQG